MKSIELVLIVVLAVIVIFFILLAVLHEVPPSAEPQYLIEEQLAKAYAYWGVTHVYPARSAFKNGMVFNASSEIFEEARGLVATLTFECSTEIANACTLEENGKILRISNNFNAQVSACCVDTYTEPKCIVKIGEETAKC